MGQEAEGDGSNVTWAVPKSRHLKKHLRCLVNLFGSYTKPEPNSNQMNLARGGSFCEVVRKGGHTQGTNPPIRPAACWDDEGGVRGVIKRISDQAG